MSRLLTQEKIPPPLILFICALLLIPSAPSLHLHPLLLHPQRRPQLGPSHGVRSTLPFSSRVLPVHARSSLTALPLPSSHGRARLDLLRARHGCAVTFPVPAVASSGDPFPMARPSWLTGDTPAPTRHGAPSSTPSSPCRVFLQLEPRPSCLLGSAVASCSLVVELAQFASCPQPWRPRSLFLWCRVCSPSPVSRPCARRGAPARPCALLSSRSLPARRTSSIPWWPSIALALAPSLFNF
jgi:hypothetical protein